MKSFYRNEDVAGELLAKERKGFFSDRDFLLLRNGGGVRRRQEFYYAYCVFFLYRMKAHVTDYS